MRTHTHRRVEALAEYAKSMEVRLMIDAEQTYFQPAIDALVLNLQAKYNKDFPTIFNTYQCYLKDSLKRITEDMERAKRMGFVLGGVGGRVCERERDRDRDRETNGEMDKHAISHTHLFTTHTHSPSLPPSDIGLLPSLCAAHTWCRSDSAPRSKGTRRPSTRPCRTHTPHTTRPST